MIVLDEQKVILHTFRHDALFAYQSTKSKHKNEPFANDVPGSFALWYCGIILHLFDFIFYLFYLLTIIILYFYIVIHLFVVL